jgi:sec-independent protein translocase protein TatB
MLPDVGATEYLVIAIVALIVVGPKDLPVLLKKLGQFLAKLRGMASEFRASFDEMARQSELDELRKEVEAMRSGQLTDMAAKASGLESEAAIDEINQGLADVGVQLHPPMSYQYEAAAVAEEMQPLASAARMPRAKAGASLPPKLDAPAKAAAAKGPAPKRTNAPKAASASKTAAPPKPTPAARKAAAPQKAAVAAKAVPTKASAPARAAPPRSAAKAKTTASKAPANPRRPTVERG